MEKIGSAGSSDLSTEHGFKYWTSRSSLSPLTRDALLNAAIVLVPHENFGNQTLPVFPVGTAELFRLLRDRTPDGIAVEIAVEDDDYREVALHSELIRLATILVKWVAAPVAVGLLVDYLKTRLGSRFSKSQVEVSLVVEQEHPGCHQVLQFNYKGPAASFEQAINSDLAKASVTDKGHETR